jgi:hypothetical protein
LVSASKCSPFPDQQENRLAETFWNSELRPRDEKVWEITKSASHGLKSRGKHMNRTHAEYTTIEQLYVHDCAPRVMPGDIYKAKDLALYYTQRFGAAIASVPVLRGGMEAMEVIAPLLDALERKNRAAFHDILIVPHGNGLLIGTHIERNGVGNEAVLSFRRHAETDAQRAFVKNFTVSMLRTQTLRCKGGSFHPISHANAQAMQPFAITNL